ncbi:hypothetical protein EVAR_38117_1 [Eumeta japonica]|uniref:Uncharacterized protein n=1 Tax=Eumeta variegata TaxID=151549 RepID=A0A4C1X4J5_EUMVA|nr:hypothetical protein EVAR_38117_1 [Eumeta japonica]
MSKWSTGWRSRAESDRGPPKGRSKITALLKHLARAGDEFENRKRNAVSKSVEIDVVYTDHSRAFDRLDHGIPLTKLNLAEAYTIFVKVLELSLFENTADESLLGARPRKLRLKVKCTAVNPQTQPQTSQHKSKWTTGIIDTRRSPIKLLASSCEGNIGHIFHRRRKAWAVWATAHGLAVQRASRVTAKKGLEKYTLPTLSLGLAPPLNVPVLVDNAIEATFSTGSYCKIRQPHFTDDPFARWRCVLSAPGVDPAPGEKSHLYPPAGGDAADREQTFLLL